MNRYTPEDFDELDRPEGFFAYPMIRLLTALVPFFILSAVFVGVSLLSILGVTAKMLAVGALILYIGSQELFLRRYLFEVTMGEYVRTNVLAYGVLTVLSTAVKLVFERLFGDTGFLIHTWLFMPTKLVYYAGFASELVSGVIVGAVLLAFALVYPKICELRERIFG